jgi:Spy/CpxP family protein refolding chaperone
MLTFRFLHRAACFSLIAFFTATSVLAQEGERQRGERGDRQEGGRGRPGFGGGGFGGGGQRIDRALLLRIEKVRDELKIEEAQAATIDAALDAYREERDSARPRLDRDAIAAMSEEQRTAEFEKIRKAGEELSKKTDEVLAALLEPTQTTRLDQITVQARLMLDTIGTLKADDMKGKLKITDEQMAKLSEVETASREEGMKMFEEMRNAGGGGGRGFEGMREKMTEMRKKATESAMAVLTDDQKKSLDDLKGEAVTLEMQDFMGGRGFGGPGGGPGGPGGQGGRRGNRPPTE